MKTINNIKVILCFSVLLFTFSQVSAQVSDNGKKLDYISSDEQMEDLNSISVASKNHIKKEVKIEKKEVKQKQTVIAKTEVEKTKSKEIKEEKQAVVADNSDISIEDLDDIANMHYRRKKFKKGSQKCFKKASKVCDSKFNKKK